MRIVASDDVGEELSSAKEELRLLKARRNSIHTHFPSLTIFPSSTPTVPLIKAEKSNLKTIFFGQTTKLVN